MVIQTLVPITASELQVFFDNPEQLLQESVELQLAVASFVSTPRSLLEILVNSPWEKVAEAAKLHINYAGEIGDNWQQVADEILQSRQMGQNDRLAVELLRLGTVPPCFLSEWVPADKLIQALRNPQMPLRYRLQLLERLAQEPTLEPRLQVAESLETPLAVLKQLAGDLELPVRLAVKFNPSCPPALIELVEEQHNVASNWNTDVEQLSMLGQSRWAWIRLAVAQNPNTPQATLRLLAQDRIYKIQLAVAKNPATSAEVLVLLVRYQDTRIQAAVAGQGNLTEEIMHQLFPSQQSVLKRRKNLPTSILERLVRERVADKPLWKDSNLRYLLLDQENTPTWILAELADLDIEGLVSEKLAEEQRRASTPGIHKTWVRSEIKFLIDVAKHPNVLAEILTKVSQYPSPDIKLAITQTPNSPETLKLELLEELSVHEDYQIKTKIAENLNTPVSILEKMVQHESYEEKLIAEIRRVFASEYPINAHRYEGTADKFMSDLKHEILYPANVSIDVERCIEIIRNSATWEIMMERTTPTDTSWSFLPSVNQLIEQAIPQWSELLPNLPTASLQTVVNGIYNILGLIKGFVQNHQFMRSVGSALVGNPNTPINLREQLKTQLIRPDSNLSNYNNDRDVLTALAYNTSIPEAERMKYFQQILTVGNNEDIARNPNTPPAILLQIMSQPGTGRQAVARNPNAPASRLAELAQSNNSLTLSWVA